MHLYNIFCYLIIAPVGSQDIAFEGNPLSKYLHAFVQDNRMDIFLGFLYTDGLREFIIPKSKRTSRDVKHLTGPPTDI